MAPTLSPPLVTRRDSAAMAPGQFGWDGAFGTHWCSDAAEDMVLVLMVQRLASLVPSTLHRDFDMLAYQAIDD